jgi:lysophospholipase L1-like esterase
MMQMKRISSQILALVFVLFVRASWSADTNHIEVAARPHNFSRWEKEMAAFERMDATNAPPKGAIVFTGSSTIRLWDTLPTDFPNNRIINRGFGGCEIEDVTHFADQVIFPYEPRMIFLRAGGNDLWGGKSAERVYQDFKDFVQTVHAKLPKTEIVFISLSPSISRWKQADKEKEVNRLVRGYVRMHRHLKYIETYALPLDKKGQPRPELFRQDKLHFSAEGYKLLAEKVRPYLPKS